MTNPSATIFESDTTNTKTTNSPGTICSNDHLHECKYDTDERKRQVHVDLKQIANK